MKQSDFTLISSRPLAGDICEMIFSGDTSAITAPGQFVNLSLPGYFLRRPISICDWTDSTLTLLVKVAGKGTSDLTAMPAGTVLDTLSGLGNGFDPALAGEKAVLAGGGIGIAPLYGLAKRMLSRGQKPVVCLGFRSQAESFYVEEFQALGLPVQIATEDGSLGIKGFVTDAIRSDPSLNYVLTCGPTPMLKAVAALPQLTGGQFSFEARMGCGFGACVGCTIPTAHGGRRVCKDGPIFMREELIW